jgi:hypothetical protein
MYSSGNIDVPNWVYLFESRCIINLIWSICVTHSVLYSGTIITCLIQNFFCNFVFNLYRCQFSEGLWTHKLPRSSGVTLCHQGFIYFQVVVVIGNSEFNPSTYPSIIETELQILHSNHPHHTFARSIIQQLQVLNDFSHQTTDFQLHIIFVLLIKSILFK